MISPFRSVETAELSEILVTIEMNARKCIRPMCHKLLRARPAYFIAHRLSQDMVSRVSRADFYNTFPYDMSDLVSQTCRP
jgi:hypothetical protein